MQNCEGVYLHIIDTNMFRSLLWYLLTTMQLIYCTNNIYTRCLCMYIYRRIFIVLLSRDTLKMVTTVTEICWCK
jgi:hypothetical protein